MKPTSIRRGIQSRHVRSEGDGPGLGRIAKLRDVDVPEELRLTGKRGGDVPASPEVFRARRKMIVTWSIALTAVTVLVIGGFMMFWLRAHGNRSLDAQAVRPLQNVRIASRFVSPTESDALGLVKRALACRDVREVGSHFRLGDAQPAEVVDFLAGSEARDGLIEGLYWQSSMDVEGLLLEGVLVVYAGKEPVSERLALLVPDDKGVWKVDFEAFARSSKPSWAELLAGRADHALVRVFTSKDSYFNGPFLDESRWTCYAMVSPEMIALLPEERSSLYGYCKVGSPQAKAMERIFAAGGNISRTTLDIRRVEGADARQFEIARVLSEDWVLAAQPFDEKFD